MNLRTPASMITSASNTAACLCDWPLLITSVRSSTVYKYTSCKSFTSGSMSRGTAKSTMKMGRFFRARKALLTAPKPIKGNELAVQLMTMSNSCSLLGRSTSAMDFPPCAAASVCALSAERLAMVIDRGDLAPKCATHNSIISPAPTNSTLVSLIFSKIREAKRTEAAAMLMECAPISVEVLTSLATAKERWNN